MSTIKHVMYPVRRVDYTKDNHVVMKVKDYIGFVCPHCYNSMIMRASITLNMQNVDKTSETYLGITPAYTVECTKCHEVTTYLYELDPNITPMIAELNRKGYDTVYSCEGHRENEDDICVPYIMFKYPGQRSVCDYYPLPDPWYLEGSDKDPYNDDETYNIYMDENDHIIKSDKLFIIRVKNNDVPIRERMAALRRWVNNLPYCFDEVFNADSIDPNRDLSYVDEAFSEEDTTDVPRRLNHSLITGVRFEKDYKDNELEKAIQTDLSRKKKVVDPTRRVTTNRDSLRYQYSTVEEIRNPEKAAMQKKLREEAAKAKEEQEQLSFYTPQFGKNARKTNNNRSSNRSNNNNHKRNNNSKNYKGNKYGNKKK